jgi:hypothetical protein
MDKVMREVLKKKQERSETKEKAPGFLRVYLNENAYKLER